MHHRIRLAARAVASLLLAAAIATAATACGDDGKGSGNSQSAAEFRDGYAATTASYKQATDALRNQARSTVTQGADQAGMLAVYTQLRDAVSNARQQYGELDAPAEVDDDFKNLIKALDGQKKALDSVITSASSSNAAELTTSLGELARLLGEFAQLHQKIETELRD